MTTLTDRYVWAVIRSLPEKTRDDIERELRASIDDAMEARVASGEPIRTAERETLLELGDPDRLAAGFAERPTYLIGPAHYFDYVRLLKLLFALVLPLVVALSVVAQIISGTQFGGIIGGAIGTAVQVIVHIGFWVTLVFVLVDRSENARKPLATWTPESLPERSSRRIGLPELVATVVLLALFAGALVWQQFSTIFTDASGNPVPVLHPDLWPVWIPYAAGIIAAELVFAVVLYRTGWTRVLAIINVPLTLAFTIPAVWLVLADKLINPAFLAELPDEAAQPVVASVIAVALVALAGVDIVDGALKARRTARSTVTAH